MAKRRRALLNFNVPKIGRVRVSKVGLATAAVSTAILIAGWNWSSYIPYVGQYADTGKAFIRKALGASGSVGFVRTGMVA